MSALPISARNVRGADLPSTASAGAQRTIPTRENRLPGDTIARASGPQASTRRSALIDALIAHVPKADQSAARTAIPAILDAAIREGKNDANQIGYLLATAQTESDFGANMTETGHAKRWFDAHYGGQDGNRAGTDDGYAFRGRGYVQTTQRRRYAALSRQLGLPDVPLADHGKPVLDRHGRQEMQPALVAHPDALAQPQLAAKALVVGVSRNTFTQNAAAALDKTIPAGKAPGDVDFYHARALVNGIVPSQATAVATHATIYAGVLDGYRQSVLGELAAR